MLKTNGSNVTVLDDDTGNLGVGTSTPLSRLHIFDAGQSSAIRLSSGSGPEGAASFRLQADSGLVGRGRSFVIYSDDASQYRMLIDGSGNVGIGTVTPAARLDVAGTTRTNVLQVTGGSDLAENFEFSENVEPGLIVAIDLRHPGKLMLARGAYNRRVAGIISGANNLSAGLVLPDLKGARSSSPLALSGRVWVYADAAGGAIRPGDLLTTSATNAGHAMTAANHRRAHGAVIGKAMTGLRSGSGLVLVLVTLQ